MSVVEDLDALFLGYRSDDREEEWRLLQSRLAVGALVSGVVVARYPFGVFLDIGVGFPALLEIISIKGMTPETYRADKWCPLGSEQVVYVFAVPDGGCRQIALRQLALRGDPPEFAACCG